MMFWDSSAVVPLLLNEKERSPLAKAAFAEDPHQVVWWATPVDCHREGMSAEPSAP